MIDKNFHYTMSHGVVDNPIDHEYINQTLTVFITDPIKVLKIIKELTDQLTDYTDGRKTNAFSLHFWGDLEQEDSI